MRHAEKSFIFHPNQHRFRRRHGCEKQLTEFFCDIAASQDQGEDIEACILDFSKTFDKVSHKKLLYKLASYGVSYQLTAWIDDFLTDRTQRVVIDAKESSETSVPYGVLQGSMIGPAKFLFCINDLADNLRSFIRLFADDTIAYHSASNHSSLQENLTDLSIYVTWGFTSLSVSTLSSHRGHNQSVKTSTYMAP